MNAYHVDAGTKLDYHDGDIEYRSGIVIAASRGRVRAFMCREFDLDMRDKMSIHKICEVDPSTAEGWNEDVYVSIQLSAMLNGCADEFYSFAEAFKLELLTDTEAAQ